MVKPDESLEHTAWDDFVAQYYREIYHYALRVLGSVAEAEDVTQETFLAAYLSRDRIERLQARFWLYRTCRNRCIDLQRWWKRWKKRLAEMPVQSAQAGEGDSLAAEIESQIRGLPLRQREVFVLRHWQGFSTAEVAQLLGIGQGSVKSHLVRAISKLKSALAGKLDNQTGN